MLDYESINVDAFVNAYLTGVQLDNWYSTRSGHRFLGHEGKKLIIFTFENDKPKVKDTLSCESVNLSFADGMFSLWRKQSTGDILEISHIPTEIADKVFLYHTFDSNVNYRRMSGTKYQLFFSMVYRSRHNYSKCREEGIDYVLESHVFNKIFEV